MSKLLSYKELIDNSVETGSVIKLATAFGSRQQEILEEEWKKLGFKKQPVLQAPEWSLFAATLQNKEIGDYIVRKIHADALENGAILVTSGTWVKPTALASVQLDWQSAAESVFGRSAANVAAVAQEVERKTGIQRYPIAAVGPHTDSHVFDPKSKFTVEGLTELHTWTARTTSKDKGIKAIWGETACNKIEALGMAHALAQVSAETGKPWGISLTPNPNGDLRCGTPIEEVVREIMKLGNQPLTIGLNCIRHDETEIALVRLTELRNREFPKLAIKVYTNGPGHPEIDPQSPTKLHWVFSDTAQDLAAYKKNQEKFATIGANIIGGCCGATGKCGCIISDVAQRHNQKVSKKPLTCDAA